MKSFSGEARSIIETLKNAGHEAYAVGGSVRDYLMDKNTRGWDFTTSATPEEIQRLFPDSFYDNAFGTVGVKIYEDKGQSSVVGDQLSEQAEHRQPVDIYEITTYRTEGRYSDNRHPDEVTWGKTIEEDLSRRDFTINAIAWDGETYIDPYGGREDIKNKTIKAVGDAKERFREDALRMMRAVRIASQLGFMIEENTASAISQQSALLTHISAERIRDELLKIMASPYPADGIMLLKNVGLLQHILPELETAFTVPQKSPKRHHIYDVGTHCIMALKHCPSTDPVVRLATLLHDIGKPKTFDKTHEGVTTFYNHEVVGARMAREICVRLKLSKTQSKKIVTLVRWHQFSVDERQTDSAIRRFIRRVGKENLEDMLALRIGDRLGGGARETSWRLELYKKRLVEVQTQPFSIADLHVSGHDVMEVFETVPGPIIGDVLRALFAEVEEGKLANEREALMTRIRELKNSDSGFKNQE